MSPHIPVPGHPVGINPDWHLEQPARQAQLPRAQNGQVINLPTAASTHEFGRARLAPILELGDLVIASGPLGVGKTALVQGIGAGLHVDGPVLSPTFVISRVHRGGRLPLVHVDAYRLGSIDEIDDLDLDTELAGSVTVVEWGAGLAEQLSDEYLLIELAFATDDQTGVGDQPRTARLIPYGSGWQVRLPASIEL